MTTKPHKVLCYRFSLFFWSLHCLDYKMEKLWLHNSCIVFEKVVHGRELSNIDLTSLFGAFKFDGLLNHN